VKRWQPVTWSSGDYAVIGTTLSITGELLCEAVKLRPSQRVLEFHGLSKNSCSRLHIALGEFISDVRNAMLLPV